VIEADTTLIPDKQWIYREVFFYYNADLTATGGLTICIWMYDCQDAGTEQYLHRSELIGFGCIMHVIEHLFDQLHYYGPTKHRTGHTIRVRVRVRKL